MAELVDALDLGSSGVTRGGSSPPQTTTFGLIPVVFGGEAIFYDISDDICARVILSKSESGTWLYDRSATSTVLPIQTATM